MAASSSRATSTCVLTPTTSTWTSHALASPRPIACGIIPMIQMQVSDDGRPCNWHQKIAVMTLLGDCMRDDQVGLGVDGGLDVVANHGAVPDACRHGAGVGVRQQYLQIRRIRQGLSHGAHATTLRKFVMQRQHSLQSARTSPMQQGGLHRPMRSIPS